MHAVGGDVVDRVGDRAAARRTARRSSRRRRRSTFARHAPFGSPSARMLFGEAELAGRTRWRSTPSPSARCRGRSGASRGPRRRRRRRSSCEHGHALGRQIAGADVVVGVDGQRPAADELGRGVEGVRQRADGDAAPVDPARDAVDALGGDALRRRGADVRVRLQRRATRSTTPAALASALTSLERDVALDAPVLGGLGRRRVCRPAASAAVAHGGRTTRPARA